jgi:hypothetical protein
MKTTFHEEIHLRKIGVDDWQLWRELRLKVLTEAPYAFGSKLADWLGQGDTETEQSRSRSGRPDSSEGLYAAR